MEIVSQVATSSGIRQAVFAELVRRAAVLRRPPEDIPTVARATLEAKEESLGDVGMFAARVVAGGMDAWLSTDELWEAALEASCAQDSMPWGLDRNRHMRRVSRIRGLHPAKGRTVGSRVVRGWAGFRLDDGDSVLGC